MSDEYAAIVNEAVSSNCSKFYANGFVVMLGMGDVVIAFQQNGQPCSVLNLSYTVAKTLSIKLDEVIKNLENKTSQNIMTTDDIFKSLNQNETQNEM